MPNSVADPNQNAYANAPTMTPEDIKRHSPGGEIYEALVKKLVEGINTPTPPVLQYQPPQINPRQAFALAQNPKQSEQMMQYAAAPNQARYQQQLTAFQEAMGGQDKAMQLGTALLGQQSRADQQQLLDTIRLLAVQNQIRRTTDAENKPVKPEKPQIIPTDRGPMRVNENNQLEPVNYADTGAPATRMSEQDKTKVENIHELKGMVDQLENQFNAAHAAHSKTGRVIEGAAASWLPQAITEPIPSMADAIDFEGTRQIIGSKIRGIADANNLRNIQEIQRLLKNVTTFGAGDTRAAQSFSKMRDLLAQIESITAQTRPQTQATAPSTETPEQKKRRILAAHGIQ